MGVSAKLYCEISYSSLYIIGLSILCREFGVLRLGPGLEKGTFRMLETWRKFGVLIAALSLVCVPFRAVVWAQEGSEAEDAAAEEAAAGEGAAGGLSPETAMALGILGVGVLVFMFR